MPSKAIIVVLRSWLSILAVARMLAAISMVIQNMVWGTNLASRWHSETKVVDNAFVPIDVSCLSSFEIHD